ncbi:MAG: Gfo/Idh/MocA family oxidoreductase [Balneolales bacterium]
MINKENTRRDFIKKAALGSAGITFGLSPRSYSNVIGANEKINVAVMGVNGRGSSLAKNFSRQDNARVISICDVEEDALAKGVDSVFQITNNEPEAIIDIHEVMDDKNVDAVVIAAPDHWHAPASILACQAGKHVYVEKPLGHNPREGELLIEAAQKYNRIVQVGSQRRSWPRMIQCMEEIKSGIIGRVYFANGWYANTRSSIGIGNQIQVPSNLNYGLWQGPAPRLPYQDNLIHYNWHWFWNWGTGEALNNGNHEMDLMRWGLEVDYPTRVNSTGGIYHYKDDWQTADTQIIGYDFEGKKSMVWEGRSRNGRPIEGSGRGVKFHGENGTIVITGGDSYIVYDNNNKIVKEVQDSSQSSNAMDTTGPGDRLDSYHIANFLESISNNSNPTAEVGIGHKSVLLGHLGNIAHRIGRSLQCDPKDGRILGDSEAMKLWGREYEKGWEPSV